MANTSPDLIEDKIQQIVSYDRDGISAGALTRALSLTDNNIQIVQASLKSLIEKGHLLPPMDKRGQYRAKTSMSDVVVAKVKGETAKNKIVLQIENVDRKLPDVTVSLNEFKRPTGELRIYTGEPVALKIWRHKGVEFKGRFLGSYSDEKPPSLTGRFKKQNGESFFVANDSGIQAKFRASTMPDGPINPKKSFHALIPRGFNPFNPILEIGEQKWDPDTGESIHSIIAKKHRLQTRHNAAELLESKLSVRRSLPNEGRRDLTKEKILVIDPVYARDHDDGILVQRTRDGFRTLVVIADVPYYVRPDTLLDAAAKLRGFTHYFPDRTIHMLPERLVRHASLTQGTTKPVIYVEQFWDEYGVQIKGTTRIGAGLIAAQRQMTYGQFEDHVQLRSYVVRDYVEFGEKLIEKMRHGGGLVFDADIDPRAVFAQSLVAGMMVEANTAIAGYLLDKGIDFLSRSHTGSDSIIAFEELKAALEKMGYDVPDHIEDMHTGELNRIMRDAEYRDQRSKVESLIRKKFLHRAIYTDLPYAHFGLQRDNYTHATSPIRRYADIVTLRAVHTSLGNHELGLSERDGEQMFRTANLLNYSQEIVQQVSDDTTKYYAVRDLQRLEGHTIRATLSRVERTGAEITLHNNSSLKQWIPYADMPEQWRTGYDGKSLIFNNHATVREGEMVRIRIGEVHPQRAEWSFSGMEAVNQRPKSGFQPFLAYKAA